MAIQAVIIFTQDSYGFWGHRPFRLIQSFFRAVFAIAVDFEFIRIRREAVSLDSFPYPVHVARSNLLGEAVAWFVRPV